MVIGICDDNREDAIRIQQEVCKCLKLFGEEKTITMISEDESCWKIVEQRW